MSKESQNCRKMKGLLERLEEGTLIGDGGYVFALEKRCYVKAGPWTPEVVIENPEAVRQLHREFLRAGSDVVQAFTFYSSDDKLKFRRETQDIEITCEAICIQACKLAREEADRVGALMAGSISRNVAFSVCHDKEYIQAEVRKQANIFKNNKADFIICEFFDNIVEMEWTIEEALKSFLPIVATMCIGVLGDIQKVSVGECAVRMTKAGATVVGVNCLFDPAMTISSIRMIKEELEKEGLNPYLITQPNGFLTTGTGREGYSELPEFPFAMESRTINRFDVHRYAREAYKEGVRYIGGCCGFEAYHIRAIAEELMKERGVSLPPGSDKHEPWGAALKLSIISKNNDRANRSHWENLVPCSGRTLALVEPTLCPFRD